MFGKIRDKLKNVFSKSEEVIEENPDEVVDNLEDESFDDDVLENKDKKEEEKKIVKSKKEKKVDKKEKNQSKKTKERKDTKHEDKLDEINIDEKEEIDESDDIKEDDKEEKLDKTIKDNLLGKSEKNHNIDIKQEIDVESDVDISDGSFDECEDLNKEKSVKSEKKKGFFSRVFGGSKEKKDDENQVDIDDDRDGEIDADIGIKKDEELLVEKEHDLKNVDEIKEKSKEKKGIFSKLVSKKITENDYEKIWVELELFLLEINVAYEIVEKINEKLRDALIGNSFDRFKLSEKIREVMEKEVYDVLLLREGNFKTEIEKMKAQNDVMKILVLGVNGTGKTTSIAKIVKYLQNQNLSVVVAAADTFRAAAVEQLEEHSKKLNFKLIMHKGGSDPAAVAFDAIEHAKAKSVDVVLIDTAGRMPNNSNLMMELQKVKRVSDAQHVLFVGDSVSGNDLIDQIELFNKGVNIDGVVLTKVDTDERPGSIVTTAYSIEKPIYFLGVGQGYDDLVKFDAKEISHKLFSVDED